MIEFAISIIWVKRFFKTQGSQNYLNKSCLRVFQPETSNSAWAELRLTTEHIKTAPHTQGILHRNGLGVSPRRHVPDVKPGYSTLGLTFCARVR